MKTSYPKITTTTFRFATFRNEQQNIVLFIHICTKKFKAFKIYLE